MVVVVVVVVHSRKVHCGGAVSFPLSAHAMERPCLCPNHIRSQKTPSATRLSQRKMPPRCRVVSLSLAPHQPQQLQRTIHSGIIISNPTARYYYIKSAVEYIVSNHMIYVCRNRNGRPPRRLRVCALVCFGPRSCGCGWGDDARSGVDRAELSPPHRLARVEVCGLHPPTPE